MLILRKNSREEFIVIISTTNFAKQEKFVKNFVREQQLPVNYSIINSYNGHYKIKKIKGSTEQKIVISKDGLAGGGYVILQLLANDFVCAWSGMVSEILLLLDDDEHKKIRSALANVKMNVIFGRKTKDNLELEPALVRKFVSHAMTYSSHPTAIQRSINIREQGYQLSSEDIADALSGLRINYIKSASLTRLNNQFSEKNIGNFIEYIYKALEGQVSEDVKKSKLYYDQEICELKKFLQKEKVSEEDKKIIFAEINKLDAVLSYRSDREEKKESPPISPSPSPSPTVLTYHLVEKSASLSL